MSGTSRAVAPSPGNRAFPYLYFYLYLYDASRLFPDWKDSVHASLAAPPFPKTRHIYS